MPRHFIQLLPHLTHFIAILRRVVGPIMASSCSSTCSSCLNKSYLPNYISAVRSKLRGGFVLKFRQCCQFYEECRINSNCLSDCFYKRITSIQGRDYKSCKLGYIYLNFNENHYILTHRCGRYAWTDHTLSEVKNYLSLSDAQTDGKQCGFC
jgi:hypothetical protein